MTPVVLAVALAVLACCPGEAAALTIRRGMSSGASAEDEEPVGRISVEEFYERARPVDDLYPGARRGPPTLLITGAHWTFLNNRWNDLYVDRKKKGDEFRSILREGLGFDFIAFDRFCRSNKRDFFKVVVFGEGYLVISPESQAHKYIVPVPAALARRLEAFLRPNAPSPKED